MESNKGNYDTQQGSPWEFIKTFLLGVVSNDSVEILSLTQEQQEALHLNVIDQQFKESLENIAAKT